jgi:D-3-phosphoglycerate dehydrogenase
VGIIGHGHIGSYLAGVARALGMHVLIQDPQAQTLSEGMHQVELDTLLAESDYVVCLAPALPETVNLMGRDAYARMKPDAIFINASRGELVDEEALRDALDSGAIAGCALDVGRAQDQMPPQWLAGHPRVIATPHIGGLTPQAAEHQALDTVAQVRAILRGEPPPHAVNLAQATRLGRLRN